MSPKTLFEKFGHHCEIQSGIRDIPMFRSSKSPFTRFIRLCKRIRMINETNKRGYNYLRSQKKIENEYRKQLLYPYIIHPFSDFRKYWEFFMSIIILIQAIMVPLDIATYNSKYPDSFVRTSYFVYGRLATDIISLMEVLVNFFSGYCEVKKKIVVLNPHKIFKNYIFSNFIIDLYASIPTDVLLNLYFTEKWQTRGWNYMFHYCGLLKLFRYTTFIEYCYNITETSEISYAYFRVTSAVISFFLYVHVLTCFLISFMSYEYPFNVHLIKTSSFTHSYGTNASTFLKIYARFFYCTCLLILNSGFSIATISNGSNLLTVNIWLISKLLFILTIAYFLELHISVHSASQKFVDMVNEVKDFMRHRQVPNFLQKRILAYYDIKYQNHFFQESEILDTVSGQLRQEIIMNTCGKLVENVTFFKNLPLTLLVRIVSCLRYEIFLTNDVISKAGTTGDCMHFISTGTVAVFTKSGQEICHLQDGDYFGEIAMVMKDSTRVASVIAAEVCELYRLDRKDFIRAIIPYPDLYDRITYVAGDRMERTDIIDEAHKNTQHITKSEELTEMVQ
ncbi:PREDICTED: potassium/sodium hyperpolarization-activated cyclic nucleotide-gated channel 1-like [Nicrophorus vespilloides]|uniref:Potassium/sodium hyperpolarization-activated cyclic nucleotide-gated channel 1-like n=1 Tax=Nicrophorus vespilloides TaxID=110193 RepID=A0ABM1NCB4_NICVS|nr:PREDICTED: potassium/sodium hyperpolarization-activated cyclic nucleotide-gated channel 1-like [Nicrophorus vespilloides]